MSTRTLVTSEELWKMVADGSRYELSRGELLPITLVGVRHAIVVNKLARLLGDFVERAGMGLVGPEIGFKLQHNPDTLRAPDLAFIAREKYEQQGVPEKFAEFSPDIAVEVLSPEDRASDINRKVEEYLLGGVRLIWIVDPATQTVTVYRSLSDVAVLTADQKLDGQPVLPGLSIHVSDIFAL